MKKESEMIYDMQDSLMDKQIDEMKFYVIEINVQFEDIISRFS